MGRGGTESLLAAGGPEVPGLQGRAPRAWPVLPTFMQAASEFTPSPLHAWWWLPGWGAGNCLAGDLVPHAPLGQQNVPLHGLSTRLSQG